MSEIIYVRDGEVELDLVIELYRRSTLGERRPVEHRAIMEEMMRHANLIWTAWAGEALVGIARALTDFSYVAYLADLAVHRDFQKLGIGKELIRRTRSSLKPTCFLTLLSAPAANDYYPRVGFEPHPRAWTMPPMEDWK